MDFMKLLQLLPLLSQAMSVAQSIQSDIKGGGASNMDSISATITKEAPAVVDIFRQIGQLFNRVAPAQQMAAAATALAPELVKKIQAALNGRMNAGATQLAVDGAYGPKTKAAVLAFQQVNNLKPDEWAGPLTQQALGVTA